MLEMILSPVQTGYWLNPWLDLFLLIHVLGVASFSYIVAKRLTPLLRGERDFRFDRPWIRFQKVFEILAGAVEASALHDRGNHSYFYFCGFPSSCDSRFRFADSRIYRQLRGSRLLGKSWAISTKSLRTTPQRLFFLAVIVAGIRRAGLQTSALCGAGKVRQSAHGRCDLSAGADRHSDGGGQSYSRPRKAAGPAQTGQALEFASVLSLPWILKNALCSTSVVDTQESPLQRHISPRSDVLFLAVLPAVWNPVSCGDFAVQCVISQSWTGELSSQ